MSDQSLSEKEQTKKWDDLLQKARLELQAKFDLVVAQLNKTDYVEIEELTHAILCTSKEYIRAANAFNKWGDLAEESDFISRGFFYFMAHRAEKQMYRLEREILSNSSMDFTEAYQHNNHYLQTSLQHTKLSEQIREIKHYQSKLKNGTFSESEFREIWDRRLYTRLSDWQKIVIQPEFDPKFNKNSQTNSNLAKPVLIDWMSPSSLNLYGLPQDSHTDLTNADLSKSRP